MSPSHLIISPGPCTPNEAGICVDLIKANNGTKPIFGVCLGHQSIGQAYGGEIVLAPTLMHGKLSEITHEEEGVFAGLPKLFESKKNAAP